jgi:hypothetical protein
MLCGVCVCHVANRKAIAAAKGVEAIVAGIKVSAASVTLPPNLNKSLCVAPGVVSACWCWVRHV